LDRRGDRADRSHDRNRHQYRSEHKRSHSQNAFAGRGNQRGGRRR
jgi:hypothetical protein